MNIRTISMKNVGPLGSAEVEFGDLTVLVGQQATGKTLFLEFLKLIVDKGHIHSQLTQHGFEWNGDRDTFLDTYLGEGMHGVWSDQSRLHVNDKQVSLDDYVRRRRQSKHSYLFYIPAQRVLTLANGWPRPFQSYDPQDPYVVREFSEQFRLLMAKEFSRGGALFPQTNRLKSSYRKLLIRDVFRDFELRIDTHGAQRRLILSSGKESSGIPYMVWSAGQREFAPLLMGLYWLLPAAKISRRDSLEWVVLEEIEMGLHPSAISTVLLIVMELLSRGYRVCLSAHSPHVLDVVWALRLLQQRDVSPDKVLEIFRCGRTPGTRAMAEDVLGKSMRVYYFDGGARMVRDISELDPGADSSAEAGWGGLTEFSGHVSDVVASVVRDTGMGALDDLQGSR